MQWSIRGAGKSSIVVAPIDPASALAEFIRSEDPALVEATTKWYPFALRLPRHSPPVPQDGTLLLALEGLTIQHAYFSLSKRVSAELQEVARHSDGGVVDCTKCAVLPDFAWTPSRAGPAAAIMMEIKPKWGGLPLCDEVVVKLVDGTERHHMPPSLCSSNCRYSMMLAHKKSPSPKTAVKYCPLDFFHCDPIQHRRAIEALLAHPMNNLSMTVNGRRMDPSDPQFYSIAKQVFDTDELIPLELRSKVKALQCLPLLEAPQLDFIRSVSSELEIEELRVSVLSARSCRCAGWVDAEACDGSPSSTITIAKSEFPQWLAEEEKRFFTAMSARDVSILVQVLPNAVAREVSSALQFIDRGCGRSTRLLVVDVDSKQHKSIGYYAQHEEKIFRSWVSQTSLCSFH